MKEVDIETKEVKGRIEVLKAMPYKGVMVYIRRVDGDIFEYIIPYKGEVYSSYLVMKPGKGKSGLSKDEVNKSASVIFAGATATIDNFITSEKAKKNFDKVLGVGEDNA